MLVIVLVTILFTTVALIAFVERAGDDLMVEAREAAARRLRRDAYSALEVTLGVLEDFRLVNGGLRSPAEGWDRPLEFAGWEPGDGREVEITFEDESGKLSLPHAETVTLVNLFKGWGMNQVDSERLSDSLMAWMKKDYVPATARSTDYEQGPLPFLAPLRPMRSFSELAAIDFAKQVFFDEKGQPTELWHRFVSAVSLFDFKETNLNGLSSPLLSDLGVIDAAQQRQFEDFRNGTGGHARQGPGFFQSTADAASVLGTQTLTGYGTTISALRINLIVRQGKTEFKLSVVVAPAGGAKLVQEVATNPNVPNPEAQTNAGTPAAAPGAENQAGAKKLNYPFTLLEIKENAEISPVPGISTKA